MITGTKVGGVKSTSGIGLQFTTVDSQWRLSWYQYRIHSGIAVAHPPILPVSIALVSDEMTYYPRLEALSDVAFSTWRS